MEHAVRRAAVVTPGRVAPRRGLRRVEQRTELLHERQLVVLELVHEVVGEHGRIGAHAGDEAARQLGVAEVVVAACVARLSAIDPDERLNSWNRSGTASASVASVSSRRPTCAAWYAGPASTAGSASGQSGTAGAPTSPARGSRPTSQPARPGSAPQRRPRRAGSAPARPRVHCRRRGQPRPHAPTSTHAVPASAGTSISSTSTRNSARAAPSWSRPITASRTASKRAAARSADAPNAASVQSSVAASVIARRR